MDLKSYRQSDRERLRTSDLLRLTPVRGRRALDVGARDGYFSKILASRFDEVVALDLEKPSFVCPGVICVCGDVTALEFPDASFDFVLCAEVLEHIPPAQLSAACKELQRVTSGSLLVGTPYRQDLRCGRTTCLTCGRFNPPWGHINSFDERRLQELFADLSFAEISYVESNRERTNAISSWFLDQAGNPFGTYEQDESCIYCGAKLLSPMNRNVPQRIITRIAYLLQKIQMSFVRPQANWIHVLLRKR